MRSLLLHALDATLSSVSRVLPSSGPVGRARASVARGCLRARMSACCSRCGSGSLVRWHGVCAADVRVCVDESGSDRQ